VEEIEDIKTIAMPYNKDVMFQNIRYENGFTMLRLRIKEGKRFTMIDLDPASATAVNELINEWLGQASEGER